MNDSVEGRIAVVYEELARLEARDAAIELAPRRVRRQTGASIVYSVRLDPAEVADAVDRLDAAVQELRAFIS